MNERLKEKIEKGESLPPLLLNLQDCRLLISIIGEIPENELTTEERKLRWKIRTIEQNIERAIARKEKKNDQLS